MSEYVQAAITVGLGVATGGLSTAVGMAFYASAAVGAVGAITGDKDLRKLGTLIGLGAGVASLAGVGTGPLAGAEATTAGAEQAALNAASTGPNLDGTVLEGYNNTVNAAPGVVSGPISGNVSAAAGIDPTKTASVLEKTAGAVNAGASTTPAVTEAVKQTATQNPGFFDKILSNPQSMYGAGLIAQGAGPVIAGAFTGNTEEEKLEFLRQQEEAKQAELERRTANFNSRGLILGVRPRAGATLWPGDSYYKSPAIPRP